MNVVNEIKKLVIRSNQETLNQFTEFIKGRTSKELEVQIRELIKEYNEVMNADPHRCQFISRRKQCLSVAEPNSKYCYDHSEKREQDEIIVSDEEADPEIIEDDDSEWNDGEEEVEEDIATEDVEDDSIFYCGDAPNDL